MPVFISKLQHNTCEKGEFYEETERTLNESIEFIKNFPRDAERTLTDIQLTGPSITIQDEHANFLKVGLYFNGKFCLYYLDDNNHLYEYHAPTIDDACLVVTSFFSGQLDLQKFENHLFNIGNKGHFVTNHFEYREKPWRILILNGFIIVFSMFFLIMDILIIAKGRSPGLFAGMVIFGGTAIFEFVLYKIFNNAIINRNNYLQISKGNDIFSFGYDKQSVDVYSKTDIDNITVYRSGGARNPNFIEVYEINFKNGSTIKLTNMLIPRSDFYLKFTDASGNNYINFIRGKEGLIKML